MRYTIILTALILISCESRQAVGTFRCLEMGIAQYEMYLENQNGDGIHIIRHGRDDEVWECTFKGNTMLVRAKGIFDAFHKAYPDAEFIDEGKWIGVM